MTTKPDALLILPRLRIQNANAISGPLTWGFPAPTAFTGFVHALHRRMAETYDLSLDGVGIVCHRFQAQTARPAGKLTHVFSLTRNPLNEKSKPASFVEEGRCHLEISLLIGISGEDLYSGLAEDVIPNHALQLASAMRLAGGSILGSHSRQPATLTDWPTDATGARDISRKLRRMLLPGFALVNREDLFTAHLAEMREVRPNATALDALLDLTRLNFEPVTQSVSDDGIAADTANPSVKTEWQLRQRPGWLVPIPVGYLALSPLYEPGTVKNARDNTVPFRFVESVYGLGQWISPHRIDDLSQLLWYHQAEPENGLYRCINPYLDMTTAK